MIRAIPPLLVGLLVISGCSGDPPEWTELKQDIGRRWPDVKQLSTSELARRLEAGERVLLVDSRAPGEFAVSHLPGARNVPPDSPLPGSLGDLAEFDAIVFYCSVGYRSSQAASRLGEIPGKSVYNLEGSIFQWANEGRAIENAAGPTERVHPYDASWGRLLEEKHRAPIRGG